MTQLRVRTEVLSLETSQELITKLLKRENYSLISSTDNIDTCNKTKIKHDRAISLLDAANCFYIKFGQLESGKHDFILCYRCMVQVKCGS